ncbi:Transcription factor iws1 [Balamuthia mandrillaris]
MEGQQQQQQAAAPMTTEAEEQHQPQELPQPTNESEKEEKEEEVEEEGKEQTQENGGNEKEEEEPRQNQEKKTKEEEEQEEEEEGELKEEKEEGEIKDDVEEGKKGEEGGGEPDFQTKRENIYASIFGGDDEEDEEEEQEELKKLKAKMGLSLGLEGGKKRKKKKLRKKGSTIDLDEEEEEAEGKRTKGKRTKKKKAESKKQTRKRKKRGEEEEEEDAEEEGEGKRRRAAGEEGEEEEEGYDDGEEGSLPPKEQGPLEEALERLKKGRRSRRSMVPSQDTAIMVSRFIEKMDEAAMADVEANRQGSIALAKLKLLPEVVAHLKKVYLQGQFIEQNALPVLRRWLEPLPDGSLPSLNIRKELLGLLGMLPLDKEHLKDSGLGKVVMFLWKSPKETKENKKLAQELIQRWSRPIFELSTDYKDLAEYEKDKARLGSRSRLNRSLSRESNSLDSSSASSSLEFSFDSQQADAPKDQPGLIATKLGYVSSTYHARIPEPASKDYLHRPQSNVNEEELRANKALAERRLGTSNPRHKKLTKKLSDLKLKRKLRGA